MKRTNPRRPRTLPARPRRSPIAAPATTGSTPPATFEPMENRRLLSVSVDAQGWTNITPSSDSRIIYVSSSEGSDSNSGLSPGSPLKTINKGRGMLRNGMPDHLLLKRGDVFNEKIGYVNQSGRSAQEPLVFSAYGQGDRPLLNTRNENAITTNVTPIKHVAFVGLHFNSNTNDPDSPDYINSEAGYAFYGVVPMDNVLIEDNYFEHYSVNLLFQSTLGRLTNISVRRNVIVDASGGRSQGSYVNGVDGILMEENLFDHNGWSEKVTTEKATIFNHNLYMSPKNTGVVLRGNIFANSSSHGVQARSGGVIENNLFLKNPIGLLVGNGATFKPGGVYGAVRDNVFLDSRDINGAGRGYAVEFGNTTPGAGTIMERNILAHDSQRNFPAIKLSMGDEPDNLSDAVGLNDLTVRNNIVYNWYQGLSTDSAYVPGGAGFKALNGLTVEDNDFQQTISPRLVAHGNPYDDDHETWDDNHYWDESPSSGWFSVGTATRSFDQWQDSLEPDANRTQRKYVDPTRTVATYNRSLGGDASDAAFLQAARQMSRANWDTAYTADGVNDYIRDGFRVDSSVPSAGLEAPDLNALGGSGHAFIVHYDDDNGIDPRTLDSSDVRVTGPNGYSRLASLVSVDRAGTTTRAAIYSIPAPDGGWAERDVGLYTVTTQSNQVADLRGNYLRSGVIGTFWVRSDVVAPAATARVSNVSQAGGKTHAVTVTYTDNHSLDASSIGSGDLLVTGPNGFEALATLVGVDTPGDGPTRVATYSFGAPEGSWDGADNGTYRVALRSAEVRDRSGNAHPGGTLAEFNVAVAGTSVATAQAAAPVLTSAGVTHTFTVTYGGDLSALDAVGAPGVRVTGPGGFDRAAAVDSIAYASAGAVKVVTYSVVGPEGAWDAGDNGLYTVRQVAQASVESPDGTPAQLGDAVGTFAVNIARRDLVPPTIVSSGFTATLADRVMLRFSENVSASLSTSDFEVHRVGGTRVAPSKLKLTYDRRNNNATLSFGADGGTGELDAGLYRLVLRADGVIDAAGNTLDGNRDGTAGGAYVILFRKS